MKVTIKNEKRQLKKGMCFTLYNDAYICLKYDNINEIAELTSGDIVASGSDSFEHLANTLINIYDVNTDYVIRDAEVIIS